MPTLSAGPQKPCSSERDYASMQIQEHDGYEIVILTVMNEPAIDTISPGQLPILRGSPHPCPYLPGRISTNEYMHARRLPPQDYLALMDNGFRRSGEFVYRPVCDNCTECVPIRIPVQDFVPSRSQQRVLKRNADVSVAIDLPSPSPLKHDIYVRYLRSQHDGSMSEDPADFEEFLYNSPTQTLEMTYRSGGDIIAVGIVDVCPTAMSSVYFYFDPDHARRSLGIFGCLCEIEECRRRRLSYWYLGYYVQNCRRMNYKSLFRPYELLDRKRGWLAQAPTHNPAHKPANRSRL